MSIAKLSSSFSVSPQLRLDDLAGIAAAGFRAVVNNRPDGEAPDQPGSLALEAEAKRLGLGYTHIPVIPGQMTEMQGRAFDQFLRGVDGPALGFCRTGTRSAGLWALTQARHGDVEQILETAARAGYDPSSLKPRLQDAGE